MNSVSTVLNLDTKQHRFKCNVLSTQRITFNARPELAKIQKHTKKRVKISEDQLFREIEHRTVQSNFPIANN